MWAKGTFPDYCAADCGMSRRAATCAYGDVHVTADPFVEFPAGFVFSVPSENGDAAIDFETLEDAVVDKSGEITIRVRAVSAGTVGNVRADSISIMKNPVRNVYRITNASIAGGTDGGLGEFFISDDYDASDSENIIGQFNGIVAAQYESTAVTEII